MLGVKTKLYPQMKKYHKLLLRGTILSIDPSIGSNSSMPGWAVYGQQELLDSGIIEINPSQSVPIRLQTVSRKVRQLVDMWKPDILVYEEIPSQRYGGGNANAHASLLKALGVVLSVPGPTAHLGLHPLTWKRLVRDGYEKGDEEDAIEMGWIAIDIAKWFLEEEENKPKAGRKKAQKKNMEKVDSGESE